MIEFISQLPTEYQEVEYIQSSGTQYIDTGYIVNASDTISWEFTAMIPSQSEAYMGANGYLQFHVTSSGVGVSTLNASGLGAKKTFRIDFSNSVTKLYIDNTLVETKNWSGSYNGTSVKLGIFKLGDADNGWHTTTSPVSCTLYEYAINIGGNEVSRCVPCYRKADNVAGLYDLVNNVFYTNAGSGVFAVGVDSNKHAIATITPGGVIPMQYALRRRMMMAALGSGEALISDLPLGALINVGTDGGDGAANYEIADINNLVPGGVVLVRKNIHSKSAFGSSAAYSNSTLDNKMTSIYNSLPEKLQSKIMDATFALEGSGSITRKVFALTYTMVGFGVNNGTTEGKALQRYDSDANRKKTYSGSAWSWWLSSRRDTSYPRDVSTVGAVDYNRPDFSTGVVPAFVISSDTPYDPILNTDGSYNLILNTYISELPLGTLINVGTDGGAGAPNYEIADKDNLVSGGVVLVRKNIYSTSEFGSSTEYPNSTLDNLIKTTIYDKMPQKLRNKMMDVTFTLYISGDITRKMFALTYTMAGFGNNYGVAEGKALQLYTSNDSRIKTLDGSAANWWLSSQYFSDYVWSVLMHGSDDSNNPSNTSGVVPAFVIPSKTPYDPTPNTDGSYNLIL